VGDIFREVDEELKQDRYEKLWKQYGKFLIGGAVLIIAAFAGWKAWENHQTSLRYEEGKKFSVATTMMRESKMADASNVFAQLASDAGSGYGILARFHQASIIAQNGDALSAIRIYDEISEDGSAQDAIRELATILGALQALRVKSINAATIDEKIQPMTGAGKPYRHVALEIVAMLAQRSGNMEKARASYQAIVDDPQSPVGIRARASLMLNIIGAA
jgi:hypothetical protein